MIDLDEIRIDPLDPLSVAVTFLGLALQGLQDKLFVFVTPESLDAWGDFSELVEYLQLIPDPGIRSEANRDALASDVAFFYIYPDRSNMPTGERGELFVLEAIALTLIWRPESGMWLVHAIGSLGNIDDLPRTSPNSAPEPRAG